MFMKYLDLNIDKFDYIPISFDSVLFHLTVNQKREGLRRKISNPSNSNGTVLNSNLGVSPKQNEIVK